MTEDPNRVILLPYDFTEVSKYAIKHAVGIAQQFNFSIKILNILDTSTKMYLHLSHIPFKDIDFVLKETCDFIKADKDIQVDYLYRKGHIGTIHDIVKELNVAYVIMGIDEPRSNSSPVMKMVGKSPKPVLVVQQKSEYNGYKNILFPLDNFPSSRQKVSYAARIAKATGAMIHIFSMQISNPTEKHKHAKIVEQVEQYFKKNEISYVTTFAKGDEKQYSAELQEYVVSKRYDLMIIMHRPPTFFAVVDEMDKRLIFNSVNIPVVCVNPKVLGVGGGLT
jgi:nucleotide-binding universal stress UspA family protein